MSHAPRIIRNFSCRDAGAGMAFVEPAFGFEAVIAADAEDGTLLHGVMRFGAGMILMGSVAGDVPRQSPGTHAVVEDADLHHARAMGAGGELVCPPEPTECGRRRHRVRDIEGHGWTPAATSREPSRRHGVRGAKNTCFSRGKTRVFPSVFLVENGSGRLHASSPPRRPARWRAERCVFSER